MPPTVEGNKDTRKLETVRDYEHTDPVYYDVLNRPYVDLRERTVDLDRILTPGRGLRVRQEIPVSASVEVETGWYVDNTGAAVEYAGTVIGPVAAAAAGNRRIDLVWLNLETGAVSAAAGTEVVNTTPWADIFSDPTSLKGNMPANDGGVPLAYLYVDDTIGVTTDFDEGIAVDNPGHIRDARLSAGTRRRIFESQASNFASDVSGGSAGTLGTLARADHRHPLNVNDAASPELVDATATAPSAGTANQYSRSNHVHQINLLPNANVAKDTAGGAAGSFGALVRSDHRHPANVTAAVPSTVSTLLSGSAGASDYYARSDHTHSVSDVRLAAYSYTLTWAASSAAQSTGALGYQPYFALMLFNGYKNFASYAGIAYGFVQWNFGANVEAFGSGISNNAGANFQDWTAVIRQNDPAGTIGTGATGHRPIGAADQSNGLQTDWNVVSGGVPLFVTNFGPAGVQLDPNGQTITGTVDLLVLTLL